MAATKKIIFDIVNPELIYAKKTKLSSILSNTVNVRSNSFKNSILISISGNSRWPPHKNVFFYPAAKIEKIFVQNS